MICQSVHSAHTHPLLLLTLPIPTLLKELDEVSKFLNKRGLVSGWDDYPCPVNNKQLTWKSIIQVRVNLFFEN